VDSEIFSHNLIEPYPIKDPESLLASILENQNFCWFELFVRQDDVTRWSSWRHQAPEKELQVEIYPFFLKKN